MATDFFRSWFVPFFSPGVFHFVYSSWGFVRAWRCLTCTMVIVLIPSASESMAHFHPLAPAAISRPPLLWLSTSQHSALHVPYGPETNRVALIRCDASFLCSFVFLFFHFGHAAPLVSSCRPVTYFPGLTSPIWHARA